MTHKELIEKLIYDENIADNIDVCDSYEEDKYGNSIVTMSFEGVDSGKKKGVNGMLVLLFNKKGRMVGMEMATCKKGKKDWQVAISEKFINLKRIITGMDQ
jgi:hypothetical protein